MRNWQSSLSRDIASMLLLCSISLAGTSLAQTTEVEAPKVSLITVKPSKGTSQVDHYFTSLSVKETMCSIAVLKARLLDDFSEVRQCVKDDKDALIEVYKKTAATLKGASKREALKAHFVQAITTIEGLVPQSQERKIDYERRTNANKVKLKELKTSFEIE